MPLYTKEGLLSVGDQSIKAADNVELWFGDGTHPSDPATGDVKIYWDGTNLILDALADDTLIEIGDAATTQLSFDLKLYGGEASGASYLYFDASANLLYSTDIDLKLNDNDVLNFGTNAGAGSATGDVQLRWDATDLDLLAAADDTVFKIGNGTNSFDVWIYGNTASDYILWDASAGKLSLEGAAYLYGANVRQPITLAQGTGAVTAAQSGGVFVCTVDAVITLPSTAAGLTYTFINGALSSGTGLSISPAAADNIISTGLTAVDNKDLINSGATDVVGDCVTLVGDGVDGWIVTNMRGTWAKES